VCQLWSEGSSENAWAVIGVGPGDGAVVLMASW